jgi:hypothetical protein
VSARDPYMAGAPPGPGGSPIDKRCILPPVTAQRQLVSDVLGLHVSVRRVLLVNVDYSSLSFQLNFF